MDSGIKLPRAGIQANNPKSAASGPTTTTLKSIGGYDIIEKIGQGGMGAVYKARQRSLDRIIALKILPPSIARDTRFIERFQREARTSARVCHPNVVQGIDVGQDAATGLWYFAMEFVDGPTLKQLIKEAKRLPERKALAIVRDVARGLNGIASLGLIHRDIKPDNILLSRRGEVKIADLGLSRAVDDDAEMTQSGQVIGTAHYMAPEQVRGLNDLDIRMDLYALGATLFHAVTGTTPFQGSSSAEIMSNQLTEPPPLAHTLNPEVSEGCSRLILKLMEKHRSRRIQTPMELIERIDALLATPPAVRRNIGPRVGLKPSPVTRALAKHPHGAHSHEDHTAHAAVAFTAHKAARTGSPGILLAMIGSGLLAVVGACFTIFSDPGKPSTTTAPKELIRFESPAHVEPAAQGLPAAIAPREDKGKIALDAATAFEKAHPEDFPGIVVALKDAEAQANTSALASAVHAARQAVETRWATRFEEKLTSLAGEADRLFAQNEYARASVTLTEAGVPENLRVLDWQTRLETARNRFAATTEANVARILSEARALAQSGESTGLERAIETAQGTARIPVELAPSAALAREDIQKWNKALAASKAKAATVATTAQPEHTAAFEALRKELAPLLKQNHFSAALERVQRQLDGPAAAQARTELQSQKTELEAILALRQQAIVALNHSAKPVTLRRGKSLLTGKLTQDTKGLTLKLADGPELTLALDQLDAADINAYAPEASGAARAEDLRRRGLLFLAVEDFARAREYFTAAKDTGLGDNVAPYLERIDARERGELELRAQKDWLAAEALFAAKRWADAQGAYAQFANTYKNTETYTRNVGDLEQRQLAVDLQLHPLLEGLIGTYFRGSDMKDADRLLTRVDKTIDFDWTKTPPAPEVPHDNYCVRWEGIVKIVKPGRYTFAVTADDGARLWVDGKQLVDAWSPHPLTRFAGEVELTAGTHDIKVEYLQQYVDAICKLTWGLKGSFDETVVPGSALWHDAKIKVPETKP